MLESPTELESQLRQLLNYSVGDSVFYIVLLLAVGAFVSIEAYWLARRIRERFQPGPQKRHQDLAWSIVPLLVLVLLTMVERSAGLKLRSQNDKKLQIQSQPAPSPRH